MAAPAFSGVCPTVNALRRTRMFNVSVATPLQHLLFLFLFVVAPIWDLYATPKLKRNPTSEKKIRYYKTICTWLWIASALAVVAIGLRPVFTIILSPGKSSGLFWPPWFST